MLAYFCKYVPEELFQAFGTNITCIEPHVTTFTQADALMHPNMCSFSKAVLEEFEKQDYDGMIFTSCCDSSRRLYDILRHLFPDKFFFCLDLPRKINDFAVTLYTRQLEKLIDAYTDFSEKTFSEEKLLEICRKRATEQKRTNVSRDFDASAWRSAAIVDHSPAPTISTNDSSTSSQDGKLHIALAGARPGSEIRQLIADHQAKVILDLTCTGIQRNYDLHAAQILPAYAHALLDQLPCMRMAAASNRQRILEAYEKRIDGIIYHTVKFCDIYAYEYTKLHETSDLPILKIETDATAQCAGQILTRLEAFLESLRVKKGENMLFRSKRQSPESKGLPRQTADNGSNNKTAAADHPAAASASAPVYVMGIDSGSTSTNAVILNQNRELIASAVIRTGAKSGESAQRILKEILEKAGLQRSDLIKIVSTGYGRVSIPFADENVTEISCHGKGAHYLNPQIRTILDIGGQDSKAIHLNEKGDVTDFVMNDKCAAGTGRFLDVMARILEIDVSEMAAWDERSQEEVTVSSTCTVFAESEVISLLSQKYKKEDIIRGIHNSVISRAAGLLYRTAMEEDVAITGGGAKNAGVVRALERELKHPVYVAEKPQITGAVGAALFAWQAYQKTLQQKGV